MHNQEEMNKRIVIIKNESQIMILSPIPCVIERRYSIYLPCLTDKEIIIFAQSLLSYTRMIFPNKEKILNYT